VFWLEAGRRRKIVPEGRDAARRMMKRAIDDFSPGVVLRNLIQDRVFDPLAVVVGPAEIAYRAQTVGVHEFLSVPTPVVFPRMLATYIPPPLEDLLKTIAAPDVVSLLARPSFFARSVYEAGADRAVEAAADELRETFQGSTREFLDSVDGKIDRVLQPKLAKGLADVERRLDRVLRSAGETGKRSALARWPFLAGIGEVVRRNEKPQDRSLSLLTPFLFCGERVRTSVTAAARSYVTDALDGETFHVVYST
jgi:hypothetical protein